MNDTTTPATIADTFAQWLEAERAAALATDPATMEPHLARAHQLALSALTMPATTAADVWALVAMTNDRPNGEAAFPVDMLAARAFAEVAA